MFNDANELYFSLASDIVFSPWANPGGGIAEELDGLSIDNGSVELRVPADGLADVGGTIYIWGHGNYSPIIAGGDKQVFTARNLARLLVSSHLPQGFDGDIVVWSCWGGLPGGIAPELLMQLRNRKYDNVRVWGARYLTGTMRYRKFLIIPNVQMRWVGEDDRMVYTNPIDQANRRVATRDDLIGYPRN